MTLFDFSVNWTVHLALSQTLTLIYFFFVLVIVLVVVPLVRKGVI